MNYRNEEDQYLIVKELEKRIYCFNMTFHSIFSSYDKKVVFDFYQELLKIEENINIELTSDKYSEWKNKLQEIYSLFNRRIGARVSERPGFFKNCICDKDGISFYKDCPIHGWEEKKPEKKSEKKSEESCSCENKKKLSFSVPFNYTRESIWEHRVSDSNSSFS